MSISIGANSPYYKGKENLPTYGNGNEKISAKEEMVKYEFNTEDEKGNKVMDKMTKAETIETLNEIGKQYGESVLVSISGDGLAALVENKYTRSSGAKNETEEQKTERTRKNELFQGEIKTLAPRHQIIPNIQTNKALVDSLEGLADNVVDTVYGIISENLLKRDIGDMTEEERQNLISLGMEQAGYIAENYISEDKKEEFMSVMETIAKYGMNGKTNNEGKVTFDIKKGPMVGMPDDYDADMDEVLKDKAPETYKEMMELFEERGKTGDKGRQIEIGKRMIELMKQARSVLNTSGATQQKKDDYMSWKEQIEKTEVVKNFQDSNYQNANLFIDSIMSQNKNSFFISQEFLKNNMKQFFSGLEIAIDG